MSLAKLKDILASEKSRFDDFWTDGLMRFEVIHTPEMNMPQAFSLYQKDLYPSVKALKPLLTDWATATTELTGFLDRSESQNSAVAARKIVSILQARSSKNHLWLSTTQDDDCSWCALGIEEGESILYIDLYSQYD